MLASRSLAAARQGYHERGGVSRGYRAEVTATHAPTPRIASRAGFRPDAVAVAHVGARAKQELLAVSEVPERASLGRRAHGAPRARGLERAIALPPAGTAPARPLESRLPVCLA